ncbi:MAG: hypothetical protein QHC67_07670 [Sphingobium sp.]|uniref:hypothetical protein n=1 Tax=Sphingobium sp. TaxID=1912891 RepID=UPI0029A934E9|nr:hypothetical protein [Sphingobium sp.]MDX3909683.1 hypothetical protein [Sphingobium sp.]
MKRVTAGLSAAVILSMAFAEHHFLGTRYSVFLAAGCGLWLISRIDNSSGAFVMLGVLVLIAVLALALLLAALALGHRLMSG